MSSENVLQRLASGEILILDASYSYQSRFGNGDVVPHQIMSSLLDRGHVKAAPTRGNKWELAKEFIVS